MINRNCLKVMRPKFADFSGCALRFVRYHASVDGEGLWYEDVPTSLVNVENLEMNCSQHFTLVLHFE